MKELTATEVEREMRSELVTVRQEATPSDLIRYALKQDDVDLDRLERLYELQQRYEQDQARKAYVADMAKFKAEPLTIIKDKHVSFSGTSYDHASIGNVVGVVCAALGKHGFSHRWDTSQGDAITVTCVITHSAGHSESTTLTAKPDDSGKKNAIQSIASTITYLQRYTLLAATGLATSDQEDDDGRAAANMPPTHMADEYADWRSKIDECKTPEDFQAVWKEMTPQTRGVMAPYVKAKKEAVK